ncbi:FtsX-like permease family protein [Buchnera aphidicola (Aphis helianthi)]|uniref:FtsX-like permease family protein n=1 Tax=Buchnera aphidicola (Aphis helianthi) TaxID=2315802 RepID=A0A4D6XJE7_9GAMM|nr:FtsX-like permease family protein [Buchnera aphidicola]QCI17116.1 FtsX-like permease family protein [Buchnera aphidicola (Aphis helianthi)]
MNFLPFFIAKRLYCQNHKNHAMLLISILSKIGISISVFILIISVSALNGFKTLINKNVLSSLPHGIIQSIDQPFFYWKEIIKKINCISGINYSEPYILMNAVLFKKNQIRLFNIKSFKNIKYIKKYFSFQKKSYQISQLNNFKSNQIILSSNLSKELLVKKGDWIDVMILDNNFSFQLNKIKIFSFQIKSIFNSNGISNANIGLISFSFFENHFNINNYINTIELYMSNPLQANKIILDVAKKIQQPVFLYTWINNYKYIYDDIKKIKIIIFTTLFLIIIISCFSVISISLLSISKRVKDIAILRSIGANNILIQLVFLYYGFRLVFIGNIIGLIAGFITVLNYKQIMFFLEKYFNNNLLLNNIYYHHFLLLQLNLSDIIIIFLSTIIIGLITNWYPSYYASKINPSKILKKF